MNFRRYNHHHLIISVILFFIFLTTPLFSQQEVLLIDDFEPTLIQNEFGEETAAFADEIGSDIIRIGLNDFEAFRHKGKSLKINYTLSQDSSGFCGYISVLPVRDFSNYKYLSFWVKSKFGGDMVQIEFKQNNDASSKIVINNYLPCGLTDQWQKVVIPLDAFWNITNWAGIKQMGIIFESRSAYLNESPLSGEVYFDDFLFGTFHPGLVKIDPFSDKHPINATGANNGIFAENEGSSNYSGQLICASSPMDNCNCKLRLNFDNGEEDFFGGFFAILGGDSTGWIGVPQDIFNENYDSLYFKAYALNSFSNPGNFKVELKEDENNKIEKRVLNIGLEEKGFGIAFSDFNVIGNPERITEFVLVFEKNYQEVLSGSVIIDDIELRKKDYQFPDNITPAAPQNLTVDNSPPSGTVPLQGSVTVSATIQNNDERLESVRLEYYQACDWYCLERTYAPFNSPQASFTFSANTLPAGLPLTMRVVAENYNGLSSFSEEFQATVLEEGAITPELLFENSYKVFEFLRTETGVYSDAINLNGEQFHPVSVATTGMGLIALCIADANGWITNAEELALETLKSMNGLRPGFQPERNCAGWFRHFIKAETGAQEWDSEFSSIDSGILTAGALFCKKYFSNNDSIGLLADALYLSTDWESMLGNPATGEIYLISDCEGNGQFLTKPYNEYMLVAWLAKNDFRNNDTANSLWVNKYADPAGLPTSDFMGIDVLTDFSENFLSGFVHQFTHYLCHYYTAHPGYQQYFENAMRADSLWWRENTDTYCYAWGFGAGSSCDWVPSFYNADNIIEHPGAICSPHIIAGFIPANPNGLNDLLNLHATPVGVYQLPDNAQTPVLWRFSVDDPAWMACDLQGIDFSTMLLGLAAHPEMLGNGFFFENNDFNYPSANTVAYPPAVEMPEMIIIEGSELRLSVWDIVPGVAPSMLEWSFQGYDPSLIEVVVDECKCEIIFKVLAPFNNMEAIDYTVTFPGGEIVSGTLVNTRFEEGEINNSPLFVGQNYPNPFNTSTIIPFRSNQRGYAWLKIFDARGKEVYRRALGELIPGNHKTEWNGWDQKGNALPAGTYFYAIQMDNFIKVRKMSTFR